MDLEETAVSIENMTIRGAGRIARAAASALKSYAENYQGDDYGDFKMNVSKAAERLLSTRPTAISLSNSISLTLLDVFGQADLEAARQKLIQNAENFVSNSNSAVARIGALGGTLLEKPGTIITICNSSAAISAIEQCHRAGNVKRVYACETRPKRQGLITIKELAAKRIPVTLIVDSAMRFVMPQVDIVFTGADTVESDGSVINKIGTAALASIAREHGVPVYTFAETYKFMPASKHSERVKIEERSVDEIIDPDELPAGVEVFNPVFDRVPPELITGIVTEEGIIKPADAPGFIETHIGGI